MVLPKQPKKMIIVGSGAIGVEFAYFYNAMGTKVTIIEYASMTCVHCANFHKEVYPKIKKNYIDTNKIKFIFRDFPLDKQALFGSVLAKCAPKEKYFDFVKLILTTQKKWI